MGKKFGITVFEGQRMKAPGKRRPSSKGTVNPLRGPVPHVPGRASTAQGRRLPQPRRTPLPGGAEPVSGRGGDGAKGVPAGRAPRCPGRAMGSPVTSRTLTRSFRARSSRGAEPRGLLVRGGRGRGRDSSCSTKEPLPPTSSPSGTGGASRSSLPPPPRAGGPEGKPCPSFSLASSQVAAAISVPPSPLPPAGLLHL